MLATKATCLKVRCAAICSWQNPPRPMPSFGLFWSVPALQVFCAANRGLRPTYRNAPPTFPAASANAWHSPGLCCTTAPFTSLTRPPATSTSRARTTFCARSAPWQKAKAWILISHRLANVIGADNIFVLQNGRVAEQGRHEALLAQKGCYAKLWALQAALENYGREAQIMNKRSGFQVMRRLIGLVRPLTGYMLLAIAMGLIGHLCAAFITVAAALRRRVFWAFPPFRLFRPSSLPPFFSRCCAAGLRYAEQACNHFIAFKLLALLRAKVFFALRRPGPSQARRPRPWRPHQPHHFRH